MNFNLIKYVFWLLFFSDQCPTCFISSDFFCETEDSLDGWLTLESSYWCKLCDSPVNYWAYGNLEEPVLLSFKEKIDYLQRTM